MLDVTNLLVVLISEHQGFYFSMQKKRKLDVKSPCSNVSDCFKFCVIVFVDFKTGSELAVN